ncbi:aspartate/glutamate racemase family protein [Gammaproteobacteria bacterium LSUCC0112]|nr:aspartate/glutamate racemase family protein [Gammaproteobacteria bacterium LSUCC0112]
MKTIGLLGGMSWESTQTYYRAINEGVRQQLGGLHSAKIILYSVDFAEIEALQMQGDWDQAGKVLADAALAVQHAGADFLVICTNTMHKVAPAIANVISLPILHIADATADELIAKGVRSVGLLGTRFTMEQAFYKDRLTAKGINVVVPDQADREVVNCIIYEELCLGIIQGSSRLHYLEIINRLQQQGAEAVILGCTEISLLVQQSDTPIALFDTTAIHAQQAVRLALAGA